MSKDGIAVDDQNIEGVELHFVIMLAAVKPVEVGSTVDAEEDGFAVDNKRGAAVAEGCFGNEARL